MSVMENLHVDTGAKKLEEDEMKLKLGELHNLERGKRTVYHEGRLGQDRPGDPRLTRIAREAMELQKAGKVSLLQEVLNEELKFGVMMRRFKYIAEGC